MKYFRYVFYFFLLIQLNACYPDADIYPEETDIVYTSLADGVDFSTIKYYRMYDSVLRFSEEGLKHQYSSDYDELLISHFEENLKLRGFVKVEEQDSMNADVILVISDLSYVQLSYYWCCMPYGHESSYAELKDSHYSKPPPGTFLMHASSFIMIDMLANNPSQEDDTAEVYWRGISNGLLSPPMENRLTNNIDRMFLQSPYLKALN